MEIDHDEWISAEDIRNYQVKECLNLLTPTEMEEHALIIENGKNSHDVIKNSRLVTYIDSS